MTSKPSLHLIASDNFAPESSTWTGQDEGPAFSVAAGATSPTLVPDAINGHAALRFSRLAALSGPVELSANAGTVMMVISQTNRHRNKVPWSIGGTYVHAPYSDSSSSNPPGFSDNAYVRWRPSNRSACGVAYGAVHLLSWVEDGSSCKLYNDGELEVSYEGGSAPAWGRQTMTVGNYRSVAAGYSIEGLIAEVLVFPNALTDEERDLVEIGLMRKYALGGYVAPDVRIEKIVEVKERVFTEAGEVVESDEHVVVVNHSQEAVDISGWILNAGAKTQNFEFPEGTVLEPGASATIWTGRDIPQASANVFSFNSGRSVWNNAGDVGLLSDADGLEISRVAYGNKARA